MKSKIILGIFLAVSSISIPVAAQGHDENRESANQYNLYERNRDDRDFNQYDYPSEGNQNYRNRRYNSNNYYQNGQT